MANFAVVPNRCPEISQLGYAPMMQGKVVNPGESVLLA